MTKTNSVQWCYSLEVVASKQSRAEEQNNQKLLRPDDGENE